ncbi:MAG: prepilin-type N-terminal cleavage/methylation domain-containing protein [Candidatus Binatia bacterium]
MASFRPDAHARPAAGAERNAGYTLLEVLTALTLMAVLGAIAVPEYRAQRLQLGAAQRLVIAQLRLARTSAITTGVHFKIEFPQTTQLQVERMQLVSGVWESDASKVRTITLPAVTRVESSVVGTGIEFDTRGQVVNLTQPQQIDLTDAFGAAKSLQVWPSGQVNEL